MIKRLTSVFVFLLVAAAVLAQGEHRACAESEVRDALAKFVYAFDNLDWEAFRLAFDDNATVFYPRAFPERADGRAEFEKTFRVVFHQIRGRKTAAPYIDIQPRDMKVQMFGDCAIATFHLGDRPGLLNRRTIVSAKTTNVGWKIVHLHASEVPTTSPQRRCIYGKGFKTFASSAMVTDDQLFPPSAVNSSASACPNQAVLWIGETDFEELSRGGHDETPRFPLHPRW